METKDLNSWNKKLRAVLAELTQQDFGYPLSENKVRDRVFPTAVLPEALRPFYAICDGVSLPDVHVGYFIDPASRVATATARGEPTSVQGRGCFAVQVFGSDGGGGRFALRLDDGGVYYLPPQGAVRGGIYLEDNVAVARRLAESVAEFLCLLEADVEAFLHGSEQHAYITR